MKRAEEIFFKRLLQTDLTGDVMVKQFENIKIVHSLRTGRHTEPEPGIEIGHDLLITSCTCSVRFVSLCQG